MRVGRKQILVLDSQSVLLRICGGHPETRSYCLAPCNMDYSALGNVRVTPSLFWMSSYGVRILTVRATDAFRILRGGHHT